MKIFLRLTRTALCAALILAFGTSAALAVVADQPIRTLCNVQYEMMNADYWIEQAEEADRLLMTDAQIQDINARNIALISGDQYDPFALADVGQTMSGDIVRSLVGSKGMPEDINALFLNDVPTTEAYWNALIDNAALDAVPDVVQVRFGYSVCRSTLRSYTTFDFVAESLGDTYFDKCVHGELFPFLPMAVIHESADGEWYYVIADGFAGWAKKECIALCESREDWIARQAQDCSLVVTGRELRLAEYADTPHLSHLLLPMGTRLPLVAPEDAPESLCGRQTIGCYVVKLPVRLENGMIADEHTLIAVSDDVSVGFLPCTSKNILSLAFKFLGDRYGWAGDHFATDCSGMIREIFACFGLSLPRTTSQQMAVVGMDTVAMNDMDTDAKLAVIENAPIGSLLYFSGHGMIYVGMADEKPYVISAVGRAATPDMPAGELLTLNCVSLNSLDMHRRNGTSWLENLLAILIPRVTQ